MKVALLSFGHVDSVLSLARQLGMRDDVEVDLYLIFSQKYKTSSILSLEDTEIKNGLLSEEETRIMLGGRINAYIENFIKCRIFMYNSATFYDLKNLVLSHRLASALKRQSYDVIHFNGTSGFLLFLHIFLRKYPRVNTVHDPVPHSGEDTWFDRILFKLLFRQDIEYILHSDVLVDTFIQMYSRDPNRVHRIYYGALEIYRNFSDLQTPQNRYSILFFGRISPYKGIEYLIKAAKIVRDTIPDLEVIIAGNGRFHFDTDDIREDRTFRLVNRYITNEELTDYIQRAALVVCPYTDATQSGVVMTAYAFNKPVIATKVGGLPEVVEDRITGIIVPPRNPNALASVIAELLLDSGALDRLSYNIKTRCLDAELSWKQIAQQTMSVYEKALGYHT